MKHFTARGTYAPRTRNQIRKLVLFRHRKQSTNIALRFFFFVWGSSEKMFSTLSAGGRVFKEFACNGPSLSALASPAKKAIKPNRYDAVSGVSC